MKNYLIVLLTTISYFAVCQTQQNINKNLDTVSNVLTKIDSIRFNGSLTNMEVVLQNGTVEFHSISDIINVNFNYASQHSCGAESVHNSAKTYGSMTDQQGNVYKTILIGTQEWMAENLKTSIYRNGEPIATNLTDAEWTNTANTQIGAWVFYNNDSLYDCPYGKLYNWYAVADPRHVCPSGWHEPTDGEWTTLLFYLDGESVPGGKMKATGTQYWFDPNQDATNESGFSCLPGGYRFNYGDFNDVGIFGFWWSSSEFDINHAWSRYLYYNDGDASQYYYYKQSGYSVRCLRD